MLRQSLLLTLVLSLLSTSLSSQDKPVVLEEVMGDLDQDGTAERIVVYSTKVDSIENPIREVHIFKKSDTGWNAWKQFTGGIMPSKTGGTSTDPFVGIEIKDHQLVFYHAGGDKDKWNYTHYFRLHNNTLELVRAKISFGALCDSFTNIDFDLLVGLLSYKQESDNCSQGGINQTLVDKKELAYMEQLPLLQSFSPGDNRMEVPGTSLVFVY